LKLENIPAPFFSQLDSCVPFRPPTPVAVDMGCILMSQPHSGDDGCCDRVGEMK